MNTNALLRSVFGFSRSNIQALVYAVEIAHELMFVKCRNRNSIKLSRDIYSPAAEKYEGKTYGAVVQQIERLCNKCWDKIQADTYQMERLIGTRNQAINDPSDVIFLMACYLKYQRPFQEVVEEEPGVAF